MNRKCEFLRVASSQRPLQELLADSAASRKEAALAAEEARSFRWFWS